jgi:hypothetical protein
MTKNIVIVYRVGSFFFFPKDNLVLNDIALILGADMDSNLSIETHMKYDKLLILRKKVT